MSVMYLCIPKGMFGGLREFPDAESAGKFLNEKVPLEVWGRARILCPSEAEIFRAAEFPETDPVFAGKPREMHLLLDDIDRHGDGCECGLCDVNGKSYGVGIFPAGGDNADPAERIYAASETSAMHNARMLCEKNGWIVASGPDEEESP